MPKIGVTGHRGLGAEIEKYVRSKIYEILSPYPPSELVGVSCIADGADSVFAHVVLDLGGRLCVIVPARRYRDGLPADHYPHYDRLFAAAYDVLRLDHNDSDADAHMEASRILVDSVHQLIAVWDGLPARGYGGTADVVAYAKSQGKPVTVVWPEGAQRD